jgi:membrane-associated phospholipid phosphatase
MKVSPSRLVLAAGAAWIASSATRAARNGHVPPGEERLFREVNALPGEWHAPIWVVMNFGGLASVGVTAGVIAATGDRRRALRIAVCGTAVWGFCKGVKRFVGRGRPADHLDRVVVRGKPQAGLGFPSGHAAVAATLATMAGAGAHPTAVKWLTSAAAAVAGARMYVGAHLPLDVVGGAAIGLFVGNMVEALSQHDRRAETA